MWSLTSHHDRPNSSRVLRRLSERVTALPTAARFLIAAAAGAIGIVARLSLDPVWGDRLPFITLFPAVMLSAWLGGFWPGIVTTAISTVAAEYFWVSPGRSWTVSQPSEGLGLVVFVSVCVVISILNETWRRGAAALIESEQRLEVTLESIGDAVMTTDIDGRVTRMNRVAEALTGWTVQDALGRPLEDVLVMFDERTQATAVNPVGRVLREGVIAGLANHTVIVSRDGRRIPIDDSAAPIRSKSGAMTGAIMVFRDISERRRIEEERSRQVRTARELAAIVESSDDAIISKDLEGTIRSWNKGAERLLGYTADEVVGQSIRTIIPANRWPEEDGMLNELRLGRAVDHFETLRCHKDGREVAVSLTLSPIYAADGVVVGASSIARNIGEQKQIEAERTEMLIRERAARADLERASRIKDDFLAVLSHELRTPLQAVIGYVDLLMRGTLQAEAVDHAHQAIRRNAQAQARLVESLLDLSRVIAGKLELNVQELELVSVVVAAMDALRPEALKKQISLDLAGAGPIAITGDSARLEQVFWNLLSNAIKFTPPGGTVTIDVHAAGGEATVRVADNGRGISSDLLPLVFDRFTQGTTEESDAQRERGLGLGLALVRELVQAHHGSVTAASDGRGHGSIFTVTLPVTLAPPGTTARDDLARSTSDITPSGVGRK
jgi:PAS domain S-box-containing protein